MHLGAFDFPGRNGGKRAVLRGEPVISRKAIAQGMSDVLRCPVCSCALCFVQTAHETAGAARIRHSLRPLFEEGGAFLAKLGRIAPRECGRTSSRCLKCEFECHLVIASEAKQSMPQQDAKWIAWLAMTRREVTDVPAGTQGTTKERASRQVA